MTDYTKTRERPLQRPRACFKSVIIAFMVPCLIAESCVLHAFYTGDVVSRSCAATMLATSANVDYMQAEPVKLRR
ncbi:hypothetical protein BH10PLA2_BH10PLA2_08360 [soil metagenome]